MSSLATSCFTLFLFSLLLTSCFRNNGTHYPQYEQFKEDITTLKITNSVPDEIRKYIRHDRLHTYKLIKIPSLFTSLLVKTKTDLTSQYIYIYSDFDINNTVPIASSEDIYSKYVQGNVNREYLKLYSIVRERLKDKIVPNAKTHISGYGAGGVLAMILGINMANEGFDTEKIDVTSFGNTKFSVPKTVNGIFKTIAIKEIALEGDELFSKNIPCCTHLSNYFILQKHKRYKRYYALVDSRYSLKSRKFSDTVYSNAEKQSSSMVVLPLSDQSHNSVKIHNIDNYIKAINKLKF